MDNYNKNKNFEISELFYDLKLCNLLCQEYEIKNNLVELNKMINIRNKIINYSNNLMINKYSNNE